MIHLHDLEAMQDAEGCFASSVSLPGATVPDRNGFVTVIVVRALRHSAAEEWDDLRASALSGERAGGFRFLARIGATFMGIDRSRRCR
jgi:hypothetical protein